MFAELPAEVSRWRHSSVRATTAAASPRRPRGAGHGRWFDFLGANRQRIAPQASADQLAGEWRQRTLERLSAWGFNSLGNWSDPALAAQARMPYSLPLSIAGDYATVSSGFDWWGAMPDPFDPRFAMAAERVIAIAARDHRDDPWLLGYYADNELAWAGRDGSAQARYGLAFGALRLSMDSPAKRAFVKQLKAKYLRHEALAQAWGIELAAWGGPGGAGLRGSAAGRGASGHRRGLQRLPPAVCRRTSRPCATPCNGTHRTTSCSAAASPSALPRRSPPAPGIATCSVSTSIRRCPGRAWTTPLARLDKPVLISEFHFGSRDRGPFWGGVSEAANERARGDSERSWRRR